MICNTVRYNVVLDIDNKSLFFVDMSVFFCVYEKLIKITIKICCVPSLSCPVQERFFQLFFPSLIDGLIIASIKAISRCNVVACC